MKFTPKNDQELADEERLRKEKYVWPAGSICDYEIESAIDKVSSKGNEMIEISVKVFNAEGKTQNIFDYLGEWNLFKLKHICEANNMADKYEAGDISSEDLYYKTGQCRLKIQKGAKKDDGTFYSDKNVIDDFLKSSGTVATKKAKPLDKELDDEIPF